MSKQPSKKSFKLPTIQFPRIPRFITESSLPSFKFVLFGLVTTLLVAGIVLRLAQIQQGVAAMQLNNLKRQELLLEKNYWQDVIRRHPGYRDATFKLAVLSLRLGQKDDAKMYIDQTLQIDPNFKAGRELAQRLSE